MLDSCRLRGGARLARDLLEESLQDPVESNRCLPVRRMASVEQNWLPEPQIFVLQSSKVVEVYELILAALHDRERSGAVLDRTEGLKPIPGMPVEAFVQTDTRSVMSYLLKPLHDQVLKVFRER